MRSLLGRCSLIQALHIWLELYYRDNFFGLYMQEQQQKRDRSAQIADHRRSTQALDRCNLCFGSAARQRHLTISLGQTAYLALPAK